MLSSMLFILGAAVPTQAVSPVAPAADERDAHDWSIGVGVTLLRPVGIAGGLGGIGFGSLLAPMYGLAIERRLYRDLWLTVGGSASLAHSESAGSSSRLLGWDASLGARYVFLRLRDVHVAAHGAVNLSHTSVEAPSSEGTSETSARSIAGNLGFGVDYAFTPSFSLRFSSDLFSVGSGSVRAAGASGTTESSSLVAAFELEPALQFHVEF